MPGGAGIVAIADQVAGHRLDWLNGGLYRLADRECATGFVVVTQGNDTFGPFTNSDGTTHTVQGFNALVGYDMASGLGTIEAALFVPAIARHGDDGSDAAV